MEMGALDTCPNQLSTLLEPRASDAPIVAAARTAIGPARKDTLARTDDFLLAEVEVELRRRGATLGVVSTCAGGGMGSAMVIEIV
jgi:hypothetical protein